MSRFFVTATDTGVGKTEIAVALLRLMARSGQKPFAFKPFESAGDDSERLQEAAGDWQPLEEIAPFRFRKPLAPAIAARLEGRRTSWARVRSIWRRVAVGPGVVEGAGGLFVPLDARHDVIDLISELALPTVVVARAGLGTVNHTSLTLEALGRRGVRVRAVVLNQAVPRGADLSVPYNRGELQRRFPRVRFLGPTRFEPLASRRQRQLMKLLAEGGFS